MIDIECSDCWFVTWEYNIQPIRQWIFINQMSFADFNGIAVSDNGPIVVTYDDTKPDGSSPGLMGFLLANQARQLCTLSKEERYVLICIFSWISEALLENYDWHVVEHQCLTI